MSTQGSLPFDDGVPHEDQLDGVASPHRHSIDSLAAGMARGLVDEIGSQGAVRTLSLARGLAHLRAQEHFAAHAALEEEWREAPPGERDFLQGLVHVAVAWHHAASGNRSGSARQVEKAERRLAHYPASHRGVDLDSLRAQLAAARALLADGSTALSPLRV